MPILLQYGKYDLRGLGRRTAIALLLLLCGVGGLIGVTYLPIWTFSGCLNNASVPAQKTTLWQSDYFQICD
jgi:hypothetical protein